MFLGGMALSVDGESVDIADRLVYRGALIEGVPNLAVAIGYTNASWTLKCDLTNRLVARILNHMHSSGMGQVTARNSDPTITTSPVLDLNAGYLNRATDRLPKSGSKAPWKVHHSYLRDYREINRASVDDGVLRYTNQAPVRPTTRAIPTPTPDTDSDSDADDKATVKA